MGTGRAGGPGAPLPPTLVFVAGLALAAWLHAAEPLPVDPDGVGTLQMMTAIVLMAIGVVIFLWGLSTFARVRTGIMLQRPALTLVTFGPYRWSRNPQYIGFTSAYVGVALLMNTAWALVLLPLVLLTVGVAVIAREERYLRATFGGSYDDYCRRVGRWL